MAQRHLTGTLSAALLLGVILAANALTSAAGMVPIGHGLEVTAGTFLVGFVFLYRDVVHRVFGPVGAVAVITAGAVLSYVVADPRIATASAAAFALSELADLAVFQPLDKRHMFVLAVVLSNVVGVLVDTFVFLPMAGFPVILAVVTGQLVVKLAATLAVLPVLMMPRGNALLR